MTTHLSVINQALRLLGDHPIEDTTWPETTPTERGDKVLEVFDTVLDDTLIEHPWNFAIVRATLRSYVTPAATLTPSAVSGDGIAFTASVPGIFYALGTTAGASDVGKLLIQVGGPGRATIVANTASTPAATLAPSALTGTGINFTSSPGIFSAADVGKILRDDTGDGIATITAFTSTSIVVATINTAFAALTAIPSGSWSLVRTDHVTADITTAFLNLTAIAAEGWILENPPPDWGYTHSLTVPTDLLRIWRAGDDEHEAGSSYQREGDYIVSDESDLSCRYIARVTDPAKWPPYFSRALTYHLAAVLSDDITGKGDRIGKYWDIYQAMMKRARGKDGMEGTPETGYRNDDLVTVRYGGGRRGIVGPRLPW